MKERFSNFRAVAKHLFRAVEVRLTCFLHTHLVSSVAIDTTVACYRVASFGSDDTASRSALLVELFQKFVSSLVVVCYSIQ